MTDLAAPGQPADVVPERHFDHHSDPALLAGPRAEWARLGREHRSFLSTAGPRRIWYLTRYEDIRAAAEDPDLFSSTSILPFEADSERPKLIPEEIDPPEHTGYRQLLTPHYTAREARNLEPAAREIMRELTRAVADAGGCDFVADVARPYSATVLMRQLGLPLADRDTFLGWVNDLMITRPEDDPDGSRRMTAAMSIFGYLGEAVQRVAGTPEDGGLLGHLCRGEVAGRPIDPQEVVRIGFQLCMAGVDTLAGVLGFVFRHLADDAELRAVVRADPSDAVAEELLRCFTVTAPGRVVTRDVTFAGCPMRAGDRVVLPFAAANLDPDAFAAPDRVDVTRRPNRHLAFGAGPHRCLGAAMSRMELTVALDEWHRLVPDYSVASDEPVGCHVGSVAGLDALPLRW